MDNNSIFGVVFILIGFFSLFASIKNWSFFFRSVKTKWLVNIIGKGGTRLVFGILGLVIIVVGILAILGNVDLASDF